MGKCFAALWIFYLDCRIYSYVDDNNKTTNIAITELSGREWEIAVSVILITGGIPPIPQDRRAARSRSNEQ